MLRIALLYIFILPAALASNLYPEQLCDIFLKSNAEIFKDLQAARKDSESALNDLLANTSASSGRLLEIRSFKAENSEHFLVVKKVSKAENIARYFQKIEELAQGQFNEKNFMSSNLNTKALMGHYALAFMLNSSVLSMLDPKLALPLSTFALLQFFTKYLPYYKKFDSKFLNTVKYLTSQMKFTNKLGENKFDHEFYQVNKNILENFESNTVIEINKEFLASLDKTLRFGNLQQNTFDLKVDHFVFTEGKEPELYVVFELDKSRL